jgi:hypothetical protein
MPRLIRAGAIAAIALVIAACGGTTATPVATGTPAPTTAPTAAPTATPTEAATSAPSEAASADTGAIADIAARLAALDSYSITMTIDGAKGKTSIANTTTHTPVEATKYDVSTADGRKVGVVKIGDEAWISQDGTTYLAAPSSAVDAMIQSVRPDILLASFNVASMANDLVAQGTETKNGKQATHYHIDDSIPTVPKGMVVDYWVTDDGLLVALEASGVSAASGGQFDTLDVQMTHIDDPALTIERPS